MRAPIRRGASLGEARSKDSKLGEHSFDVYQYRFDDEPALRAEAPQKAKQRQLRTSSAQALEYGERNDVRRQHHGIAAVRREDSRGQQASVLGIAQFVFDCAPIDLEVVVEGTERSEALEIPPSLETDAARAAAFPAEWMLRSLAEGVTAREKRYRRSVSQVTITVWRTDFDRATLRASERPLRVFTYTVPPELAPGR